MDPNYPMQVRTHHPESKYGLPVFVDFRGNAMPPSEGVKQLCILLDMNATDLAAACNVSPACILALA